MATAKGSIRRALEARGANLERGSRSKAARSLRTAARRAAQPRLETYEAHEKAVRHEKRFHGREGEGGGGNLLDSLKDVGGSVVGKALEVIDVPRSYAVSGLKELQDLTDALPGPDQLKEGGLQIAARLTAHALGGGEEALTKQRKKSDASLSEFLGQAKRHAGAGELFIQKPGLSTGNALADAGLGIAGDIAGDPLTYVGGGAIARMAKTTLSADLAKAAGRARKLGNVEKAAELEKAAVTAERMGAPALSKTHRAAAVDEQLARATEAGASPKALGRLAQRKTQVEKGGAFFGFGDAKAHIPGSQILTDRLNAVANATIRPARAKVGDFWKSTKARNLISGEHPELDVFARNADDPFHAAESIVARDTANTVKAEFKHALDSHRLSAAKIARRLKHHNPKDVIDSLEGRGPLVGNPDVAAARQWFNDVRAWGNEHGLDIGYVEDYLFRAVKPKGKIGERTVGGLAAPEMRRLKAGQTNPFNGEKLTGNAADVRNQLDEAYKAMHGQPAFETDLNQIMDRYASSVGHRVRDKKFWDRMEKSGFSRPAETAEDYAKEIKQYRLNEANRLKEANKAILQAERSPGVKDTEKYRVYWKDGASGRENVHESVVSKFLDPDPMQRRLAAEQMAYRNATPGHENAFQVGIKPTQLVQPRQRIEDAVREVTESPGTVSADTANRIAQQVRERGGITYNVNTGEVVEGGYMVSVPSEGGSAWLGRPEDLAEGLRTVRAQEAARFEEDPLLMLGAGEMRGGQFAVDPSIRTVNVDDAIAVAKARNQVSIWDARQKKAIELDQLADGASESSQTLRRAQQWDRDLSVVNRTGPDASLGAATRQGRDKLMVDAKNLRDRINLLRNRKDLPQGQEEDLSMALTYLDAADDALARFAGQDTEIARAAGMLAHSDIALAEAIENGFVASSWDDYARALGSKKVQGQLYDEMNRALRTMAGQPGAFSADVAEVLKSTAKFQDKSWPAQVWDHFMALTKGYQIGTGGFHIRNLFGGTMNNWLDGVSVDVYPKWWRANHAWGGSGVHEGLENVPRNAKAWRKFEKANPEIAQAYKTVRELVAHGQIGSETLSGRNARWFQTVNPLSPKNAWLRANHRIGEAVEQQLRGTAAMDWLLKNPGDVDGAVRRVAKLHFDYQDLSNFERNVVKRIIPFYTWTRRNLPLQVEMLFRRPNVFNHYERIRQNIEDQSPLERTVPNWYGPQRLLRLPFTQGGARAYLNTGAPQEDILSQDLFDWQKYAGMVTPLIKTPIEIWSGKRVFRDIPLSQQEVIAPKAWTAIPGLMPALSKVGLAKEGPGGWHMRDQDSYLVDQYVPALALARRMAPSEEKYQDQVTSAWIRMVAFPGLRFNTPREKRNERLRRKYRGR